MNKSEKQALAIGALLLVIVVGSLWLKRFLYVQKCNALIGGTVKYGYEMCKYHLEGSLPTPIWIYFGYALVIGTILFLIWFFLWLPFGVTKTIQEMRRK